MIKKLKFRFITVSISSVIIVLGIILLVVNLLNYAAVRNYSDEILMILANNGGIFSPKFTPDSPFGGDDFGGDKKNEFGNIKINEETPHETRYFSVRFQGEQVFTNTVKISAISDDVAISLAEKVKEEGKLRGYIGNFRYLSAENGCLIVFVDCTRQLSTANLFLKTSILVGALGVACIFILIVLFSTRAVAPIAESYERQKRFITDAGHELKTPLTIISANNELTELLSGATDNTRAISKQVDKMTHMVKDMTLLAKIGEQKPAFTEFSLTDALTDLIESFAPALTAQNKKFDFESDEICIKGDEGLIRRMISVVLDNACKYSLTFTNVKLKKEGKNAVLTVSNDAEGVENGNLSRCFERFYRSDYARGSMVEGSGIGLSIASEIARLHGGNAQAAGNDGVFTIKIALHIK